MWMENISSILVAGVVVAIVFSLLLFLSTFCHFVRFSIFALYSFISAIKIVEYIWRSLDWKIVFLCVHRNENEYRKELVEEILEERKMVGNENNNAHIYLIHINKRTENSEKENIFFYLFEQTKGQKWKAKKENVVRLRTLFPVLLVLHIFPFLYSVGILSSVQCVCGCVTVLHWWQNDDDIHIFIIVIIIIYVHLNGKS